MDRRPARRRADRRAGGGGRDERRCASRGGGTKLGWGRPPPASRRGAVDRRADGGCVEHNEGDLTAVVEAGLPLAAAQERVRATPGQMLALDPPLGAGGAATLGGVVATGDSGPLRHRYGGGARPRASGSPWRSPTGRVARVGRQGDQERRRIRPREAASRARSGRSARSSSCRLRLHPLPAATATAVGARRRPGAPSPRRALRARARAAGARVRSTSAAARTARAVLARVAGVDPGPTAAAAAAALARRRADAGEVVDDDERCGTPARGPALGARARSCACRGSSPGSRGARRRRAAAARPWSAARRSACRGSRSRTARRTSRRPRSPSCAPRSPRPRASCSTRRMRSARRSTPGASSDAPGLMRRVKQRFDPAGDAGGQALRGRGSEPDGQIRAFDSDRPPEAELIDDCVHCGFCLPTCPTYVALGRGDGLAARADRADEGRARGGRELSPAMVEHFDNCLGCMACVTACPSGVQYDRLIEDTRAQVERNARRGRRASGCLRRAIFALVPPPRAAAGAGARARRRARPRAAPAATPRRARCGR